MLPHLHNNSARAVPRNRKIIPQPSLTINHAARYDNKCRKPQVEPSGSWGCIDTEKNPTSNRKSDEISRCYSAHLHASNRSAFPEVFSDERQSCGLGVE